MIFLTDDELRAVSGKQKASAQVRWLKSEKIPYIMGGDGKPKVLREKVLERLGGSAQTRDEPKLRLAS
ncbi:DUF4224 domain-containing protein [Metapseudomonas furukawaii]